MNNLKKAFICAFVLSCLLSFFSFSNTAQNISNKVLRFHIPANSNSSFDQSVKLKVKDYIFNYVTDLLSESKSYKESEKIIINNIDDIKNRTNRLLKEMNVNYKAEAKVIKDYFKTREYDTFTLPAGEYTALRIILGEGKGENWWCALYPSLCINSSLSANELTENEAMLIENKEENKVSFLIYEWFLEIIKFFDN